MRIIVDGGTAAAPGTDTLYDAVDPAWTTIPTIVLDGNFDYTPPFTPETPINYGEMELSRYEAAPVELYRFTMGGVTWCYTSGDQSVSFNGRIYKPEAMTREEIQYGSEDSAGGLKISLPMENPVAQIAISGTPPQPITVEVIRYHRGLTTDVVGLPPGEVVAWDFSEAQAKLTCASVPQMLQRKCPSMVVQTQCAWALYGAGCGVSRVLFTDWATITAVDGLTVAFTPDTARDDGWYTAGYLETQTGRRAFITSHAGGRLTLLSPVAGLVVTDRVKLVAGCRHDMVTCDTKFSNAARFMGWPNMPLTNPFTQGF